jgi:hypothetical protein
MVAVTANKTADGETGPCSIGSNPGLRLDESCYAVMRSTVPELALSWFKARAHCLSVGASLASLSALLNSSNTAPLVGYLQSSGDGDLVWVGLVRNPWNWVEKYDTGKTSWGHGHGFSMEFGKTNDKISV